MAWRAADSLSIRRFLDLELHEAPPDHSTVSRTRRLIDVETHRAVFTWVVQQLADAGLVQGQTIGIDATTLEANAALRSIVRRDTGERYDAFLTRLAEVSGIATPTRAELARFDRTRKKKGSNDDWTHPQDPDAKITRMKDGRTHLAHTAEQAVDLETGAVVAVTVQDADAGDTTTMVATVIMAAEQIETVRPAADAVRELVADKGYHSNQTLVDLAALGVRTYISEPDRGRRHWRGKAAADRCMPSRAGSTGRLRLPGPVAGNWRGTARTATDSSALRHRNPRMPGRSLPGTRRLPEAAARARGGINLDDADAAVTGQGRPVRSLQGRRHEPRR